MTHLKFSQPKDFWSNILVGRAPVSKKITSKGTTTRVRILSEWAVLRTSSQRFMTEADRPREVRPAHPDNFLSQIEHRPAVVPHGGLYIVDESIRLNRGG